ncbi:L,D-transpeptidase [bacterium BFN5]|nr:L,D-transpeptidase [bacterium BFN5]
MKKYVFVSIMLLIVWIMVKPTTVQANCGAAIIINLPSRTLEYYVNDMLTREYSIAIGKVSTPSPLGLYTITDKMINPTWYPPGKNYSVPSGPNNPLGYRWMGFLPTYGIHGTNAPWSIGQVVSNGCIRLQEESVEDLYELVPEGTPVEITYQRFKLKIDGAGVASIGIYPDVYGYKSVTLAQIKGQLQEYGLEGLADDSWLQQLIIDIPDRQVPFARVHKIKVNGSLINQYVISINDRMYAPAVAVAKNLQTKVIWDNQQQTLAGKIQAVSGIVKGQTVYVPVEQLSLLLGGRQEWRAA